MTDLNSLPAGVRVAVEAVRNKKAAEVVVLDLGRLGAFTDHFVICTALSSPQAQAISEELEKQLGGMGRAPRHREGSSAAEWVLLDFGSFIVHIFSPAGRRYYDLDRLWRSAKRLELSDESGGLSHAGPDDAATGAIQEL